MKNAIGEAAMADQLAALNPLIFDPVHPIGHPSGRPGEAGGERILIFADGAGATQVISFDLPLQERRAAGLTRILMLAEANFDTLGPQAAAASIERVFEAFDPTHLVVSRFAGVGASAIARCARARSLAFVTHLDDNLFEVPESLGVAKFQKYADPARLSRLRLMCERARTVYTSTGPLRDQLQEMGVRTPVVAGDIYCALPAAPADVKGAGRGTPDGSGLTFGYMGTSGHAADLEMIAPAIADVLKLRSGVRFETFGSIKIPKSLQDAFPERVSSRKAAGSYLEFIELFKKTDWACGLAPLVDTRFNACKADTKLVEYAVAGIPAIASRLGVYARIAADGRAVSASSLEEWRDAILKLLDDQSFAADMVTRAQRHVQDAYAMRRLSAQLVGVLGLKGAPAS